MARITVEDCVEQIPNRFDLVIEASKRARRLTTGAATPCLDWENDKPTVLALREIAAGFKFTNENSTEEVVPDTSRKVSPEHSSSDAGILDITS